MDARHFDALTRVLSAPDSRRRLLALLATLPLLGGALALFAPEDAAAKERRRRRKQRHKRRKKPGNRKKGCKPKGKATVCAGKCGPVTNRQTCGKTVDCGACACGDVCASGCQFTSAQDAINTLPAGSTIRICAGTFGAIKIVKDLTLIGAGDGADNASNTILDGEGNGIVVRVNAGVTVSLQGLRITGGSAADGAGVQNLGALTMTGCTVTGNSGSGGGAGIFSQGPSLTMTDCAVTSNIGQDYGGGMYSVGAVLTMTDCDISGNQTTGNAGGLHIELGEATLTGCTVTGNTAGGVGGGILNAMAHLTLDNSHVTNNMAGSDGGVYIRDDLGATIDILGDTTICGNDLPQCTGFTNSACQDTCP